ncbi:hypothetical protein ACN28S_58835 [Cystobacter fuscus]
MAFTKVSSANTGNDRFFTSRKSRYARLNDSASTAPANRASQLAASPSHASRREKPSVKSISPLRCSRNSRYASRRSSRGVSATEEYKPGRREVGIRASAMGDLGSEEETLTVWSVPI